MHFLFVRYEAGQLKIMCVGGPNVRKDYHIDEGEEVNELPVYEVMYFNTGN